MRATLEGIQSFLRFTWKKYIMTNGCPTLKELPTVLLLKNFQAQHNKSCCLLSTLGSVFLQWLHANKLLVLVFVNRVDYSGLMYKLQSHMCMSKDTTHNYTCWAGDSSILRMGTVVDTNSTVKALIKDCLIPSAHHIIQKDLSNSRPKDTIISCTSDSHCIFKWLFKKSKSQSSLLRNAANFHTISCMVRTYMYTRVYLCIPSVYSCISV